MKSKRNLYVLALGVFGITTTEFGVIGILPEITSSFNISIEKAGWLLSAFALIVALFGPFMLMALSSFKRKRLLIASLFIFATANIISAYIGNFYGLLVVRMIPAFFHPVYWSIALSVAEKASASTDKSRAVSIIFSGLTLATVLGVPLATLMSDLFSWQSSFLLTAFINLVALAGVQLLLPDIEKETEASLTFNINILRSRYLWIGLCTAFFTIAAMYSTYGYMADFLKNITQMNGKQISIMLFMFGVVGIFGNKIAGKYMSRFPFQTTLIFLIFLAVIHLFIYYYGNSFVPMIWIIGFWGLIHSGGFLISNINVTSSVPGSSEFINSIFTSCGNFAVTAGTLLGGFWIAHFGIENIIGSSIMTIILAIIMVFIRKMLMK
ncbi:MFS transporter [Chryseobacterium sp. BIGb0232]|uniref:MFS transporter n=1 Tax=Chryseobacterium sp. BIGb0232 TaxID=2940598 RepID=UPI000F48DB48|nr:MFS transporter [Chryseobacterium sp. BIGb0232]MCS4304127.1 putative MFS family arabinose efflux permease [Chryseobacterium sp. BIGb0232]ROS17706.1 putative MFS family arabinose efflux permease [Chryseobacterium nakagawai]